MKIKSVVVLLLVLFSAIPVQALYKEGKDSYGAYHVEDRRTYPIIFIPGMAGSSLDVGGGENAWPGSLATNDDAFSILALKEDGRSPAAGALPVATGVMRYGVGNVYMIAGDWQFAPIYQGFYDYMASEGYTIEPNTNGKQFFDFPYDFRQDNRRWTPLLDNLVNEALEQTKSDKAILFVHSMGGYQARLYMKDPARAKKVAGVVFMGTPHHGAAIAVWAFAEGYNFDNKKLSDKKMWEISTNWMGGYQLLPDYSVVQDDNGFWPLEKIYGQDWISSQEYAHYLEAKKQGKPYAIRYGFPNHKFAQDSLAFHRYLGNSVDKYDWVKYYMIEGVEQPTTQYLEGTLEDVGLDKPVLRLKKVQTGRGDGTVGSAGARIDGVDEKFTVVSQHGEIPSNAKTHPILTQLRKKINDEDKRGQTVELLRKYADSRLGETKSWSFQFPEKESIAKHLFFLLIRGVPDEEKIALRDEIRKRIKAMAEFAHANIVVAAGTPQEDKFYLVVNNAQVTDAGTGAIRPSNVIVNIDSFETLNAIATHRMTLSEALKSGKLKFKGVSAMEKLKYKIFAWIAKYGSKK